MTTGRSTEDGISTGPQARVRVVEGDPPMRRLIARLLRGTGARDGREVREASETTDADSVLLNVMLPGQSAFDLFKALGAHPDTPRS